MKLFNWEKISMMFYVAAVQTFYLYVLKEVIGKKKNKAYLEEIKKLKNRIQRNELAFALHAEENALIKYKEIETIRGRKKISPRKLHIVVIRINSHDEITNSKPCSHCVEVMRNFGIRKVTYSTNDGKLITENLYEIESHTSAGYRSTERAINIINEILKLHE
jgi:deoxycytidylate deaminase